jgi:hypothetical protein
MMAEKLLHHLTSNELLYEHQYGFLPKKSTEQNLMQILNYVTTALNDGMYCCPASPGKEKTKCG